MNIAVDDGLFFVAINQKCVLGTVMAGYDCHRGWIYSMAVHPNNRKQEIGSKLLTYAEKRLSLLGCMKINLQIMDGNEVVRQFYEVNGYTVEKESAWESFSAKILRNSRFSVVKFFRIGMYEIQMCNFRF